MYFPETAYEVFGLGTDSDGKMSFALRQKEIKMSGEALTDEEIEAWLKEKGWKMKDSWLRNYISGDEMLACMDMHNENVVKDKDGNIVCIDACVIPNSYPAGMKGNFNCDKPPEHFNVKA